ncbi:MAG: hypothetical protein HN377_14615 [Alphaproteobacteria bacterium]|jgi:hypothetical protein|nr:hypothetical protein [Alphaproteobacteria bacterium]
MRILFILGWILLGLAFFAGAADVVPRTLTRSGGGIVSAHDLWYAVSPGKLVVAQIHVERLSPALWNPILTGVLSLPLWFLLGLPGLSFAWFLRPHKQMTPQQEEDLRRQQEHFELYDKLVDEARAAGYDGSEDDTAPAHEYPETADGDDGDIPLEDEDANGELSELPVVDDPEPPADGDANGR